MRTDYCGRLMILVLTCLCFGVSLSGQTVSKVFRNTPLKTVLKEVEDQTGFSIIYEKSDVDELKPVNGRFRQTPVRDVLTEILEYPLAFSVDNKMITIYLDENRNSQGAVPENRISGRIVDERGEPVIGASISLKGNPAVGTTTDLDGKFSMNVPPDATIRVSYVGYDPLDVKVGGKTYLNIVLQEKILEEVVVVGYGVQRKRDVTTSISSLRAADIQDMPVSSLEQALVGRMAGVQITQPNATPGAGMNIRVRGTGTITAGSSPLYVIDGVPLSDDVGDAAGFTVSPLASVDMADIESIEILKDASAAAIYGSRGSNGVVIITTKKGTEGKLVLTYNGYFGAQMATKKIDVLDAYEYSQLVFDAHNATYLDQLRMAGKEDQYDPWATNQERWDILKTGSINLNQGWMMPPEVLPYVRGETGLTDTDWQDEVLRSGIVHKHYVSVNGGTEKVRYLVSGLMQNEQGVVINSDFAKLGFRTKVDMHYDRWRFGSNINISRNVYDLVNTEGRYGDDGVLSMALGAAPIFPVTNEDGTYNYEHMNTTYGNSKLNNPVAVATLIDDRMTAIQMLATAYGQYDITDDLNIRTQGSWNYNNYVRDYYRPATLPTSANRMPPSNPTATSRMNNKYTWVWENTLNYNKVFDNAHTVTGLAGWTAQKYTGNSNHITATGLPQNDMLGTIPGNATAIDYDSNREEWSLLSALARVQYNFRNRYLLSAAIRADGSSRFGQNNRWGYFPSVSGAWYVTEEDFMEPASSWLTNLKLRASWGVTGNMSIGNYGSYGLVEGDNYPFGGSSHIGMQESTLDNPDIGWEKTSQVNLGMELGLFKWLSLEIDVYKGITSDMLLEVPVMEASGFSTKLMNIGKLENKGLEIMLSTRHRIGEVVWTNSFNFAMNRNKVLSLGGADEIVTQSNNVIDFVTRVGEPIGNYYTYVVDGVYQNQAEIDADVANGIIVPNAQPGDFRFKKFGEDDTINADDKQITGNYMPDFTYGFSTTLKYRSFDFSLSLHGVYGNEIANINRRYLANMEGNANQLAVALDRWVSEDNPGSGQVYRPNRSATGMNSVISTWHIEDGSYMRIREITLGYSLPKRIVQKMGIGGLRVYLSAFNPFTFTNYSGYNPEVSTDTSPIMQGVDYGTYPLAKSYVIGVNFSL